MKYSKLSLCLIILSLGTLIFFTRTQIKELGYKTLISLNIMEPCYRGDKDILALFKQEGFDYFIEDKKVTEDGLQKLANRTKSYKLKIPAISHHIYFTSNKKLNSFFLEKLKASFNKLNGIYDDWYHYIWTNQPEFFSEEITQIPGVKIKSIDELKGHILYTYLVETLKKGKELKPYYAESADLVRLMVLQKFGGMYNDLDYEIYNPKALFEFLTEFDFIGAREVVYKISYYSNSFIASKANHPILNEAIERVVRNHAIANKTLIDAKPCEIKKESLESNDNSPEHLNQALMIPPAARKDACIKIIIPDYVKFPCSEHARIYANGPPLITMSYFSKNNIYGNKDIILPTWIIMNATFARYKNLDCNYDKVTKEEFNNRENNLPNLLNSYPSVAKEEGVDNSNIYYSIKDRAKYDIVGADMFCGGWSTDSKAIKKRNYYWKF